MSGLRRDGLLRPSASEEGSSILRLADRRTWRSLQPPACRPLKCFLNVGRAVTQAQRRRAKVLLEKETEGGTVNPVGMPTFQVLLEGFSNPIEVRE